VLPQLFDYPRRNNDRNIAIISKEYRRFVDIKAKLFPQYPLAERDARDLVMQREEARG
jgi:hypothetical protein